jgi:hypothetical protein
MIVNLRRLGGDTVNLDPPIIFEGGEAQPGVLATFTLDGQEMTGRVVGVSGRSPDDPVDWEPVVTIRPIDRERLDAESEAALASLPPSEVLNPTS